MNQEAPIKIMMMEAILSKFGTQVTRDLIVLSSLDIVIRVRLRLTSFLLLALAVKYFMAIA